MTMNVFRTVQEFRSWRREMRRQNLSVGLVPTMGALHTGHISLVDQARRENNAVVISIFVNPAQFGPTEDFEAYPRTWDSDRKMIESLHLDNVAVFVPTKSEMYPSDISINVNEQQGAFVEVKGLSEQLEGITRPHFFRGVATVVTKLFNIIQPDRAYFGQKDIQQTVVLKALVRDLHIPVALRVCPTVRESDGLALSSRNAYLAANQRKDALVLYTALKAGVNLLHSHPEASAATVLAAARDRISKDLQVSQGRVSMEYLDLVHPDTLQLLSNTDKAQGGILVGAIRLKGETGRIIRLIDNVIL